MQFLLDPSSRASLLIGGGIALTTTAVSSVLTVFDTIVFGLGMVLLFFGLAVILRPGACPPE